MRLKGVKFIVAGSTVYIALLKHGMTIYKVGILWRRGEAEKSEEFFAGEIVNAEFLFNALKKILQLITMSEGEPVESE